MAIRAVAVMFVLVSEMTNGHIVAPMESFTVFLAALRWNRWLTKFPFPFHIRGALFRDVSAGGFNAIMEAPALYIAELCGRCIPWAAIMVRWRAGLHHGRAPHHFLRMSKGRVIAAAKTLPIVVA